MYKGTGRMSAMKENTGFSLIELIIVVAIMAVLVAIIAPNLTKYLGSAKKRTDDNNAEEIRRIIEQGCVLTNTSVSVSDSSKDGQWVVLQEDSAYFDSDAADVNSRQAFPKFVAESLSEVPVSKQNGKPFKVKITSVGNRYEVEVEIQ